ncbi:MAG: GNAT family N-acetyltransferase [Bacteroidota bacterium]
MSDTLPLDIRPVHIAELEELRQLAKATFVTAFGSQNRPEDMNKYVQESFSITYFQQQFHTTGTFFFFACLGQEIVGYLKLNTEDAQTEQGVEQALEIERIYVLEHYQGRGLGQQLLDFSLNYARQLGKAWVWLGVWEKNQGAIRFYERHGFTTFSQHDFYLGQDLQIDLLMKRRL